MIFDQVQFDDAKRKLGLYWSQIGRREIEVTCEFKLHWNELADIVRQREIVPKYPVEPAEGFG